MRVETFQKNLNLNCRQLSLHQNQKDKRDRWREKI